MLVLEIAVGIYLGVFLVAHSFDIASLVKKESENGKVLFWERRKKDD